jgi:hypothetical protein
MAVEFYSRGYDTTSTAPYTEGSWADAHPSIGLATYGVRSPGHWKVTAVAGADRTVSIAAGKGFGHGVTDETYANDTLQLDTIASGSRWDLIAVRRDWTPTAGESKFVKVNGGATAVVPGGRNSNPGGIDDQPLALVQVTAGQTQPTGFIDLRTWAGDGGGLIGAHDLVRSFLNKTGTRININGIDWIRRSGANDTPEWVKVGDVSTFPDVPWTNLATVQGFTPNNTSGWSGIKYAVKNGWVIVNGSVARSNAWGNDQTIALIPSAYKPAYRVQGADVQVEPTMGNVTINAGSGVTSFSATWPLF